MNTISTSPEGKRPMAASLREATRQVVNDLEAPSGHDKGRAGTGELPVGDTDELQMAGFFIISQPRRKKE